MRWILSAVRWFAVGVCVAAAAFVASTHVAQWGWFLAVAALIATYAMIVDIVQSV